MTRERLRNVLDFRLGTQSWNFRGWVGPFYPQGLSSSEMLDFYGRVFPTIEVDASFYGIPAEPILVRWSEQVPPGFEFAFKLPHTVTHVLRLADVAPVLERFVNRLQCLESARGPLLVQLPIDFAPSPDARAVFRAFVEQLPAGERWTVEFRHQAWLDDETWTLLDAHNVAITLVDGRWIRRERMLELVANPTASFHYVRWMGRGRSFADYSHPQRDCRDERVRWAEALQGAPEAVETVYGFFNNQFEGHAPFSVREMQEQLGLGAVDPIALHPEA